MPPVRSNSAANYAYVRAPHSVTTPPSTQLSRNRGTSSTRCAIDAGVRKMPLPIVEPTTTATALHRPRRRGSRSPQRSSGAAEVGREADMRSGNIHFGPHDATLRAARMGRRRLHLPAHHPRRHRADQRVRDGLRRPLAAVQRAPAPPARPPHADRVRAPTRGCARHDPRRGDRGLRRVAATGNGQLAPDGNSLQHVHWTHRLLAYTLFAYTVWWAARTRARWAWGVVALVVVQIAVGAAMVLLALPPPWQAAHVAVGAAVWAALVLALA